MKTLAVFLSLLLCMSETRGGDPYITYDNNRELTAEPGKTAALGCTFNPPPGFRPTAVTWSRCDHKPQFCEDKVDVIFDSEDVNAGQVQYRGRMSLLEPDLSKKNCSVVMLDLDVADSGFYHPIVKGEKGGRPVGLFPERKKALKVTGLRQPRISEKTQVAEGGTLNLTCDAESSPPSTVKWNKVGSDSSLVTGTQTATLVILNVTAEHAGRYRCTAHHLIKTLTAFADVTVIPVPDVPMIPNHVKVIAIFTITVSVIVALVLIGAPMAYMIHRCRGNSRDPLHERRSEGHLETGRDDGPDNGPDDGPDDGEDDGPLELSVLSRMLTNSAEENIYEEIPEYEDMREVRRK